MKLPELIAPGGSYSKAMVAGKNGADAVYLGVPFTSLRMRQNKVRTYDILQETIDDLHALGKKAYLTMNIFPRNMDIKIFEGVVERVSEMGADAVIFSDPGTYTLLRKHLPNMRLHLSTQANMLNYEAVKFRYDLGVSRVVLARELTLKEITKIKHEVPDVELEVFVHGAMCIAYSGRCLMGEYFSGRDGNKGECSHVCRYKFSGKLEEERRGGKTFDLAQDENGTYLLSSKDLCTIDHVAEMMEVIDGFKLEGRSKSELYVGATTKAYRHAIDAVAAGQPLDETIRSLVFQIPHREYRSGFLFNSIRSAPDGEIDDVDLNADGGDADDVMNQGVVDHSPGPIAEVEYVGYVLPESKEIDGVLHHMFIPKQKISLGDEISYLSKAGLGTLTLTSISQKGEEAKDHDIHCNHQAGRIATSVELQGWEVLYRPATDPGVEGETRKVACKC